MADRAAQAIENRFGLGVAVGVRVRFAVAVAVRIDVAFGVGMRVLVRVCVEMVVLMFMVGQGAFLPLILFYYKNYFNRFSEACQSYALSVRIEDENERQEDALS
jgi:hypothetical protein